VTGAVAGSWAWTVVHRRLPRAAEQARNANPYLPAHAAALDRLAAEVDGPITPTTAGSDPGPDAARWQGWTTEHAGRRWDEVPLLGAESAFHRRLLAAVDFFAPGPWYRLDPFAPLKTAELAHPALEAELAELDWIAEVDPDRRARALLRAAVRGVRADLGAAAHSARFDAADPPDPTLVLDDSAAVWELLATRPAVVGLVADKAGRELLADLLLVDALLGTGSAAQVLLHVKPAPFGVCDATAADVAAALRRLGAAGGYAATAARRLQEAFHHGLVRLRTSWSLVGPTGFGPTGFDAAPGDPVADFAGAGLTILKGDANYRRLVGDRVWPAGTDVAGPTGWFPGPVVALRALESEVVVGVSAARVAELARWAPDWRTAGTHALVQLAPGRAPG
jgi:hypothetical protein